MREILLLLVLLLSMASATAYADAYAGQVGRLYPDGGGKIYFHLKNDNGCKGSSSYYWFDGSTATGKSWYAMLLSAAITGKAVYVALGSACNPIAHQQIDYVYQDF